METALRTGLSQASVSTEPAQPAAVASAAPIASAEATPPDPVKKKKSSKHRSPSSSSRESESESSSDEGSMSSSSESEPEDDDKKKKKSQKAKYDPNKYLHGKDTVDSYERLVLANARMALSLLKKKRNIKGLLRHVILIADKADKCCFTSAALCDYDAAVKRTAGEKGLRTIGRTDLIGSDLDKVVSSHQVADGEQLAVEEAVWEFNSTCFDINSERGSFAPSLHHLVHRFCKGKRRAYYHHLPDGLHLSEYLKEKWANQFVKAMAHN